MSFERIKICRKKKQVDEKKNRNLKSGEIKGGV